MSEASVIAKRTNLFATVKRQLRAEAHGVCRQCTALSQVLSQTKDMKKRTEIIRFVFVCFACVRQNLVFEPIFDSVSDDKYFFIGDILQNRRWLFFTVHNRNVVKK